MTTSGAASETKVCLVRAIGRWSVAALMFNTIIGASVFGVPSLPAARLGSLRMPGYLIAAAGVAIIAACLAECSQLALTPAPKGRQSLARHVSAGNPPKRKSESRRDGTSNTPQ